MELGIRSLPFERHPTPGLVDESDEQPTASYFPTISPCRRILTVTGVQVGKVLHLYKNVDIYSKWVLETTLEEVASMLHQLGEISHTALEIQNAPGNELRPLVRSEYEDKPDLKRLSALRAIAAFECMGRPNSVLECFYEVMDGMSDVAEAFLDDGNDIEPMPTTESGGIILIGADWSMKRALKSSISTARARRGSNATLRTVLEWITAVPGSKNMLMDRVRTVNWRRQLFISEAGVIGAVPEEAAIGDEIWFIPGCGVPVLLHPQEGNFVVVGEAHINDNPFSDAGPTTGEAYEHMCSSEVAEFQRISLI